MNKQKRAEIILKKLKELFPDIKCALQYKTEWEFLVAVMLSAQCTDRQVNIVTSKLFVKYPRFSDYLQVDLHEFEKDIRSTGFYRQKAKNILATAKILHEKFDDHVPQSMRDLLILPGVARKTANVVLGELYGISEGIAVDTHVRRLCQLYGLTKESDPVRIEKDLIKLIPKDDWREFTLRMIEYGRQYCPAQKHEHTHCPFVLALCIGCKA